MRAPRPSRRLTLAAVAFLVPVLGITSLWRVIQPDEPANPLVAYKVPLDQRASFRGVVEERLRAGPYVYLRVRPEASDAPSVWVTGLAAATPAHASRVNVRVLGRAEAFASKRLSRTFSPLIFAMIRAADASAEADVQKETQ